MPFNWHAKFGQFDNFPRLKSGLRKIWRLGRSHTQPVTQCEPLLRNRNNYYSELAVFCSCNCWRRVSSSSGGCTTSCRAGHAFKALTSHRVAQLETKELIGAGVATSKETCMYQCTRGPWNSKSFYIQNIQTVSGNFRNFSGDFRHLDGKFRNCFSATPAWKFKCPLKKMEISAIADRARFCFPLPQAFLYYSALNDHRNLSESFRQDGIKAFHDKLLG